MPEEEESQEETGKTPSRKLIKKRTDEDCSNYSFRVAPENMIEICDNATGNIVGRIAAEAAFDLFRNISFAPSIIIDEEA
jgi:uncharacterized FlaG/YvyC family protein